MNIFAQGFELSSGMASFDAVTRFEVLEHDPFPLACLEETLAKTMAHTVILSTELFAGAPPNLQDWWYYSVETGQHISFFQKKTLKYIARQLGFNLYSNNNIHVITRQKNSYKLFKILIGKYSRFLTLHIGRKMLSRISSDCSMLKQSLI